MKTLSSLAAQREDASAVNGFLEHDADPNIATPTDMAPLRHAADALTCVAIHPAHGADPFRRN